MNEDIVAKSFLTDRNCQTCKTRKSVEDNVPYCVRYLGEAVGWQWWPQDKENTCEDWTDKQR